MTPEERVLAGFVRPATQAEFNAARTQGAPADFGGMVLPNPDNITVSEDGEIPVTRLPNGVTFNKQNVTGQPQFDVSNPTPAQVIPAAMQTVGTKFDPAQPYQKETASSVKFDPSQSYTKETTEEAPKEQPKDVDIWMSVPGLPPEIKLNPEATMEGLQNIWEGVKQTGSAAWAMGKPPSSKDEWAAFTALGPVGLHLYRTNRAAYETAKQAAQVPGAIKDINQSADPTGAYLDVAGKTAGQGAGQALVALATEGAAKGTPAVSEAVSSAKAAVKPALRATGETLKTVGKSLDPDVIGLVSPRAAHALRLASKTGRVASKLGAEETLDATAENQPFAGGVENAVPARTQPVKPAQVETMLKKSLGAPEVKPGVPLREQLKPKVQPAPQAGLPKDFTPVKSSALKGYRYSPETQELESITNSGGHYIHGDVTPEQFQAFEQAESKGKAWSDLKQNSTYVGKVVNGKRVAAVPPKELATATPESEAPNAVSERTTDKATIKRKTMRDFLISDEEATANAKVAERAVPVIKKIDSSVEIVGSRATGKATAASDTDIRSSLSPAEFSDKGIKALEDAGFKYQGADVVSPKEAAKYGKPIHQGWSDVHSFKGPKGEKLNVFIKADPAATDLTDTLQKSLDQVKAQKGGVMTTAEPGMLADRWGTSEKAIADTDAQLRGKTPQQSQDYINKLADSYKKGHPVEPVLETRDAQNNVVSVDGRHRALAAKKAGIQRIPIIVRRLGIAE